MLEFIDLHTGSALVRRPPFVLCLGNFDGVHRGHMALVGRTLEEKAELSEKYPSILGGAWCFRQPPADFLSGAPSLRITSTEEKLRLFAKAGLDAVILADFPECRDMSPEVFVTGMLGEMCNCKKAVCGFNFRFGQGGKGTPDLLSALPEGYSELDPVKVGGVTVSSSAIRRLILSGDVGSAAEMLGRPFSVFLPVVHGKRLGRTLGLPTVNQHFGAHDLIPAHGVYAALAETDDGKTYPAAVNVGTNPTVKDDATVVCESHLLGFSGEIYGERVRVSFLSRLRGEKKFGGTDELAAAIRKDIENAEKYFADHNIP